MDDRITTYSTLFNLVELDEKNHRIKDLAILFLNAMNDWPTFNQADISDFIKEFKDYFGTPLTKEIIENHKLNDQNVWQLESGSAIIDLIDISTRFDNESNFDKIVENILKYYDEIFEKVDFIAELSYLTTQQGGRKTTAKSGYRPQVKFDFEERQTSGQQTFIDKEFVSPGETVVAKIKVLCPDFFSNKLTEGMNFEFREAATIIGTGKIKQIVNGRLTKS